MSLRDQILETQDIQTKVVDVPEWDVEIEIRGLTGKERSAWETDVYQVDNQGNVQQNRAFYKEKFLVKCLYDPDSGEKIFTEEDVEALAEKDGTVISRLFNFAQDLSGMVESTAKN